jgi:sigma-B regulation protein RsbU (phosphoserine phosphatase)
VQQHLLPSCPPEIPGFEIAAASVYCDETGGDYFDFATREVGGEPRTLIAVGDVTGHGIDAALLMASARAILRSRVASSTGLAELAAAMNEQLFVDSLDGRFMTLFLLELDPQGSRIRWVSAGHEPALLYHPDRDEFEDLGGRDIPLGVEAGWRFRPAERKGLEPGQILLMGTDGIWETRDPAGELFGKDRLRQLVRDHAAGPIDGLQAAIEQALMRHRGTRAQEDDITLVVLRATGSSETIAKRAPSAPAATR